MSDELLAFINAMLALTMNPPKGRERRSAVAAIWAVAVLVFVLALSGLAAIALLAAAIALLA